VYWSIDSTIKQPNDIEVQTLSHEQRLTHSPPKHIIGTDDTSGKGLVRQNRHHVGKANGCHMLTLRSKQPESNDVESRQDSSDDFMASVREGYATDPYYALNRHSNSLILQHGVWYKGTRVAIPNIKGIRECLLNEVHDNHPAGHISVTRTYDTANGPLLAARHAINEYVASSASCLRNKIPAQKPAGLLSPLPIPTRKWSSVSTDFITGLPKTHNGVAAILVFVCRLSKMTHFVPTTTYVTAEEYAILFFNSYR